MILFWLLPSVVLAHVFEEFVFPGGFGDWDRAYRKEIAASITTPFHIFINVLFIALCFLPFFLNPEYAVAWWICMASILLVNAAFHIQGAFKTRKYSPGMVTSIVLYVPVAVYGYWFFLSANLTSLEQALVSSTTGIAYLLVSTQLHKRRAGKAKNLEHAEPNVPVK